MKYLIKRELGLDVSTTIIYLLQAQGIIRKLQKKLLWYQPMKSALSVKKPDQEMRMDIKYIYENGARKYQFSVFDPFTKSTILQSFQARKAKTQSLLLNERNSILNLKYCQSKPITDLSSGINSMAGLLKGIFLITLFLKSHLGGIATSKEPIKQLMMNITKILTGNGRQFMIS